VASNAVRALDADVSTKKVAASFTIIPIFFESHPQKGFSLNAALTAGLCKQWQQQHMNFPCHMLDSMRNYSQYNVCCQ